MKKKFSFFITLIFCAFYLTLNAQNWNEIIKATASDATFSDNFGGSVSIDGDYAIVGAAYDNTDFGSDTGSAYIFVRSGANWIEQTKLIASDAAADDRFGYSVSIDGDYAIVGATNTDDDGDASGSAYIFIRSGASWTEQAILTASDADDYDQFGTDVAINGDYVIVGSPGNDDAGSDSGSAYTFLRSGSNWTEQVKLTASDGAAGDFFGGSVSIDGDYVIAGALYDDDGGSNSGSAYIYMRTGTNWAEQTKLTASPASLDLFGASVAISGDYAIVGAFGNDDVYSNAGSAFIFMRTGTNWTEQAELTASDATAGDFFGRSVAIDGDNALVGVIYDDDGGGNSGSAYIYMRSGSTWTEQAKVTASDASSSDRFGNSVAINDGNVIVAASNKNNATGATYFYEYDAISVDLVNLPDVTAQCEATPAAPTANSGTITATADINFPITTQGTTIVTWMYDDGNGNTETQTQNIIINDTTGPSMSFANPSDALLESCLTEVIVPSPLAIEDCLTNEFALDFDGVDDVVTINQTIGSFKTIEFWMYTENGINGSEEFDYLFSFNDSNLKYIGTGNFTSNYTNETLSMVTGFGQIMTTFAIIPPGWNHIAITGNGSSFDQIIINGENKPVVNNGFPAVFEAAPTYIGQFPSVTTSRFDGQLDEIRFWNTPRTEQEIADNFEKLIDPTSPNLLAYYGFEDGTGSTVLSDLTSNGTNGVLNNMDINTDWVLSTAPVTSVTLTNDFNGTSDASGTYPEGETIVTWTASDAKGNTSTLQQTINAGDTEAPSISFSNPSDTNITSCDTNVTITSPLVSDNCAVNTALSFDGFNDFVRVPSPYQNTGGATTEGWIKSSDLTRSLPLFGNIYISRFNNDGKVYAFFDTSSGNGDVPANQSSTSVTDGQWHHIAATNDGLVTKLYIDGQLEVSYADNYVVNPNVVGIGGYQEGNYNMFNGQLDEARFWSRPLSQAEILSSKNQILNGDEPSLVAYYNFENGIGSNALSDVSGNGYDGDLINMDSNTDWITSTAPITMTSLTNDITGTSDASGTYPEGQTTVTWTATDASGNQSTLEQIVDIDCSITYIFNNGVWSPSDPGGVATADDDIIIQTGDATFGSSTTADSVTVEAGASLAINASTTLTVTNGLLLESNSTSYSSLILDGSVAGTITYERHININGSGTTGSNDLVSAPLTGQDFATFAAANPNIFNNGALYLFGPLEKVTGQYVNWTGTETTTLDAGVGYRAATSDNSVVTFTGSANNTTITNNIINAGTNNEEWNLVGNPYPSYLNVQDFLSQDVGGVTNIQLFDAPTAAIYGYDGTAQNGWKIYNLANTTISTIMAPGQGFFVSADATNAPLYDLQFTPSMRRIGSGDDFISGRNAELMYIKLNASTANNFYNTEFYFNANATEGFDLGYDAAIWNHTPSDFILYSHLVNNNAGKAIALQTLNVTNLDDVSIPLGVKANQGEQLTFSIADMNVPATVKVYLEDVVANTSTLLNNADYVIIPTTDLSGTGRFFLRTSNDALSTIENSWNTLNIFSLNSTKELVVTGELKPATILNLYDIRGRKLFTTMLDDRKLENRIDVSNLSEGVYVVNIQNSAQLKSQKVIIK